METSSAEASCYLKATGTSSSTVVWGHQRIYFTCAAYGKLSMRISLGDIESGRGRVGIGVTDTKSEKDRAW